MDPSLAHQAATVDNSGYMLQVFADNVPAAAEEIYSSMHYFFEIGATLRDVNASAQIEFERSGHLPLRLRQDVHLFLWSMTFTHVRLDRDCFQQTQRAPYRVLWEDLNVAFTREGSALHPRLELYATFLNFVRDSLRRLDTELGRMSALRIRLTTLMRQQRAAGPRRLQIEEAGLWELPRDPRAPPPVDPLILNPPLNIPAPARYEAHWATRVFAARPPPATLFRHPGHPSVARGRPDPNARRMLDVDHYVQVASIAFPDAGYATSFFWRPADNRARFIISRRDAAGRAIHYCCPLTALKLWRRNPSLALVRLDPLQRPITMWAALHFPSYEMQVLFYCTFIAMKRQDAEIASPRLNDFFGGEELEFGASVTDDRYLHRLHLLRDKDCGAVRLEASPLRGSMIGTPIWTAFITEFIPVRGWLRPRGAHIIEIEELRPYVFCRDYTLPRVGGRFQLNFMSPRDAERFVLTIRGLR